MTPKFELGPDFCTVHLPPQVSSSYVYSFGSYRVDKQTNQIKSNSLLGIAALMLDYNIE